MVIENHCTRNPDSLMMGLDKGSKIAFGTITGKQEPGPEYNMGPNDFKLLRTQIIDYESNNAAQKKLNLFDYLVHDAIFTLWNNGVKTFTASTVIRLISGKTSHRKDLDIEEKVKDSIKRMLTILINIDYTEEARFYLKENYDDKKKYIYSAALISGNILTGKINGHFSDATVQIYREPILGELARLKTNVTTIPLEILSVPVRLNVETYILRDFLLRRIVHIKNLKSRVNNVILLKTVFEVVGIGKTEYVRKKRLLDKIHKMLSFWAEVHFIDNYTLTDSRIYINETAMRK